MQYQSSQQRTSFWKTFGWIIAISGIYLLSTVIAVIISAVFGIDEYVMGMIAAMFSGIVTSIFVVKTVPTKFKDIYPEEKALSVKSPFKIYAAVIAMMCIAMWGIHIVIGWITKYSGDIGKELMEKRLEEFANSPVLLLLLLAIVVAPITEEIVFRYGVYGTLRRSTTIAVSAIVSGIIFGTIHLTFEALFYGTAIGIVFALLYEYTRNIKVSIVGHMTYNISVMFVPENMNDKLYFPIEILLIAISIAAFVVGLRYIKSSMQENNDDRNEEYLPQEVVQIYKTS
mgnify:FL=1